MRKEVKPDTLMNKIFPILVLCALAILAPAAQAKLVQGRNIPGEARDSIAAKMSPAQIAEAQRLAREWKPKRER